MKKNIIGIIAILLFILIGIIIYIKFKPNEPTKQLSYYINNMSYVKTENKNIILFSIVNSSNYDGDINDFLYKAYDKQGNIIFDGELKYETEFLSNHEYLIQLEVDNFDFNSIVFKPLNSDKSEIKYLKNKKEFKYEEIINASYNIINEEILIDIIPYENISVSEFKIVLSNSIDEEIMIYYEQASVNIKALEKYTLKSIKNYNKMLSYNKIKVYYR